MTSGGRSYASNVLVDEEFLLPRSRPPNRLRDFATLVTVLVNVPRMTYCEQVFDSYSGEGQTPRRQSPARRTSPF